MNKYFLILVLLLISGKLYAQEKQLLQQLQISKPDTTRLRLLCDLATLYKNRKHGNDMADLDTAKIWLLKAVPLSQLVPDSSKFSKNHLLMNLGEVAFARHNIPECKSYFMQSIVYSQTKHENAPEADAWERLGNLFNYPTDADLHVVEFYAKAIVLYEKMNNQDKVIRLKFLTALNRRYMDKTPDAEKICLQLIAKYQNTKFKDLELSYLLMSLINRYSGNFDKALYYSLGGVKRMNAIKDTSNAEKIYGELAQVYQASGDMDNSIYYYKKTIAIRESMNARQLFIFRTAGFVIQMLIKQRKAADGLKYISELEKRHPPETKYDAAIVAQIKADCYEALNKTALAEKNYQIMFAGLGQDSTEVGTIAHLAMARFYVNHQNAKKAVVYLNTLTSINDLTRLEIELLRFKTDSAEGKYMSAIDHFQRYKAINDSIFTLSKTKQIQQLNVQFETEKKDKDIQFFKVDRLVQQGILQKANYMRNVTLAGIGVLVLFLAFLYNGYRFKQRKNVALNQLVLEKDGLLIEKDNLLVEKQWLLKEIHHRVKNNLAIVMGLLNRQSAYINNEVALAAIQNSQNRMRSIALIHQKLYQSESLNLIVMSEYIDELIGHLKDSFDLGSRIIFEKEISGLCLDVSQAVPLGLIINEAITNSIKYAYPDQKPGIIQISLNELDNQNILRIKDNGPGLPKGFDPEKINSMGMNLMKGLSKQLGGSFAMDDESGLLISIMFKTEVFMATSKQ